jgi:hypothetical protein
VLHVPSTDRHPKRIFVTVRVLVEGIFHVTFLFGGVKQSTPEAYLYYCTCFSIGYFTCDIFIWRCQTPEYILRVDAEIPNYCLFGWFDTVSDENAPFVFAHYIVCLHRIKDVYDTFRYQVCTSISLRIHAYTHIE